jgi:DNA-binding Lrp family transcriptional regulator
MAFVLINTEMGAESEVLKALNKLNDVKEAYVVYGVYDIIIKVESDTMEKLKSMITWNVRRLNKVRSTLTMMAAKEE